MLNEELKSLCVVESSSNDLINKELVLKFLRQVLGMFSFKRCLFAWDTFEVHLTEDARKLLKRMKTDGALIPGRCTKCVQAPSVVWNKPFKGQIMKSYDEWLVSGLHQYTEAGDMKPPSWYLVVEWILESSKRFQKNLTIKSFKSCRLNLKINGSENH